jgi:hypothetical protein
MVLDGVQDNVKYVSGGGDGSYGDLDDLRDEVFKDVDVNVATLSIPWGNLKKATVYYFTLDIAGKNSEVNLFESPNLFRIYVSPTIPTFKKIADIKDYFWMEVGTTKNPESIGVGDIVTFKWDFTDIWDDLKNSDGSDPTMFLGLAKRESPKNSLYQLDISGKTGSLEWDHLGFFFGESVGIAAISLFKEKDDEINYGVIAAKL